LDGDERNPRAARDDVQCRKAFDTLVVGGTFVAVVQEP
jgi:hypothetical protein